jgi:serine/threonine protein kinase/Tfp pilus assembly protein PilF
VPNDRVLHDVAGAMVDGVAVDWASAEASADDESIRRVVRELKVIAAIAGAHGAAPLCANDQPIEADGQIASGHQENSAEVDSGEKALQTWGPLRVLERVSEGAFGAVYRAWDPRLDREVALKLLRQRDWSDAGDASVVIHEGRMLAQVLHPNVVTVHGADRIAGHVGLWMEFIHGRTLEELVRERGPFGAGEATLIALDICRALSAVHRAGLLHRDIKTQNVMRQDGGRIVLMDFGTVLDHASGSNNDASGLAGTPLYTAPEVLAGHEASVSSDIYSVGVLLYRLVTRSFPVQERSVAEVRDAHARQARTFLRDARPDLPESFVQIVERALSVKPEDRYASAGAMEAALVATNESAYASRRAARAGWMRRTFAIAATLLVMAAAGLLWRTTAATSRAPIIAVLPFKNLSTEPDSDYFVDGLTDEVIRNLSVIDGLGVRSSASSFAFKNKNPGTRAVSEQLNANLVLSASVLRAGTRLRIDAQLVRAADDVPLWSARYDRELKDIFAIQDEISRSIVNELRLTLGRGQRRYDTNVEAYELYLKGRALVGRRGIPSLDKAVEAFQQALVHDPAFAPAHAGLAIAYAYMSVPSSANIPFEPIQSIIRPAAVTSLELDPLLADAHVAMGWVHSRELDWSSAEKEFRRAIELNPSLTQSYTSYSTSTLRPLGKSDEVLRLLRLALENDPLSLDVQREIGEALLDAGRYEQAITALQRVRQVDPDFPFATVHLARALTFAGRPSEALALLEHLDGRDLGRYGPSNVRRWQLAQSYVLMGRRGDAESLLAESNDAPYRQATIYTALGDKDRAFEALERLAVLQQHQVGKILASPEMAALRGDSRLTVLRNRFGLPPQ